VHEACDESAKERREVNGGDETEIISAAQAFICRIRKRRKK